MTILIALTLALAALQLLDWFSTRTILNRGGIEQNPVAKKLMALLTMDGFLGTKAFAVTVLGYIAGLQYLHLLFGIVVIYIAVVAHNWRSMP